MIEVEIKCRCTDCHIDTDDDVTILCDDCEENRQILLIKDILNDLYENNINIPTDGEFFVGFKSKEEKETYMKGVKYGYGHAGWVISQWGGDELIAIWENLDAEFRKVKFDAHYDPDKEKELIE